MKTCNKCLQEKPLTDFYKHPSNRDRLFTSCKSCLYLHKKSFLPKEQRCVKSKLKNLCTKAKLRSKSFDDEVTGELLEKIWEAQNGLCAYSGVPLTIKANCPYSVSLDRVDSKKGYHIGNLQLVCSMVNRMKQEFQEETFLDMCEKITNNMRKTTQTDGPLVD